jgi:hypothetical protein
MLFSTENADRMRSIIAPFDGHVVTVARRYITED